jgi:TRAP-type C4-dicarboxylate transport system permease small subunit
MSSSRHAPVESRSGRVFGIPLGELGLFSSLLMAVSFGFLVFFATCFAAIMSLLFYNTIGHHAIDMADSYRYVALPAGFAALGFALVLLLGLWVRRKIAGR